jgi:hypothetical protein
MNVIGYAANEPYQSIPVVSSVHVQHPKGAPTGAWSQQEENG